MAKRSSLWTPASSLLEVGGCNSRGLGEHRVLCDGLVWIWTWAGGTFFARAIAVGPSWSFQSCCSVLVCNLLVVVWIVSGLVGVMEGILIMGSPLTGLAGLPLALGQGCRLRCGEVGCCSRLLQDVMCTVEDLIDNAQWLLEART